MSSPTRVVNLDDLRSSRKTDVLGQMFAEHEQAMTAFLRVRVNQADDRSDLIQEVFYRLSKVDDVKATFLGCKNPRGYLISMLNNLIIDRYRKDVVRRENEPALIEMLDQNGASPERDAIAQQQLAQVKHIVKSMPPKIQRAFVLNRFEHMSYQQVAEIMGVKVKRVEKYISKALALLRSGVYEESHDTIANKGAANTKAGKNAPAKHGGHS